MKVQFLEMSADFHSLSIENIATTTVWKDLTDKIIATRQKLDSLPDTDIVCFVDAYDVIVNTTEEDLLNVFKSFNADIVFGAETSLYPPELEKFRSIYPESPTIFRYLNSGCYIGYVHALKKLFSWGSFEGLNDQDYCNQYFLEFYKHGSIKLDTACKLVINMATIPWEMLQTKKGYTNYIPLDVNPCFIHFNGVSFLDKDSEMINIDGSLTFVYNQPYSNTFRALLDAKVASYTSSEVITLQGKGHTY